ncbi:DUF1836 domain-containing protein [Anaerococcus sp. WCA-380-WT-2B]|uniref:DUF1836 domain-containing protein n=1 Tax=Anaerococcus porci TaxID=2652269 RepID=A0A6N7VEJ1_9FIRM|nr:DUF1836 domain-containing protein [Anaerococcus porci]MSS77868.1 DUF1836 domain-containing protein [Anaerococcus porci]
MKNIGTMKELEQLRKLTLPSWKNIPNDGLYKEELISFVKNILEPLFIYGENFITSSMINNYVKQGHIKEPIKKKYYRDSIAQLLTIIIFKQALQIDEISKGIEIEVKTFTLKAVYDNFVEIFQDAKEKILADFDDRVGIEFSIENHHDKVLYYLVISLFTKLYTMITIKNRQI